MFEKNTPRDFFIHVGAFGVLYFATIALITLLFSVIDYAFPDQVNMYYMYQNPYSGPMRFAIASLIILTPIFVYLMHRIQNETRTNPERKALGIRKWLTYITLFIAGATVIGDLIALLNGFLGGELAVTFILKAIVLFVIMGAGFGYFLFDIKGYWIGHKKHSQIAGALLLGAVIGSIIGGLMIMGSPSAQREIRFDNMQVEHLQMIQSQVVSYWQQNGELPEDLREIESDITGFQIPQSPDGRPEYDYEKTGGLTFELCATFEGESGENSNAYPMEYGIRGGSTWEYDAGETCFNRTIDPDVVPQNEKLLLQR